MKTLYILACCCFLLAIVSDVVGKQCHTRMLSHRAKQLTAQTVGAPTMREQLPEVSFVERHSCIIGLLAAGLGIAAWIVSAQEGKRKEKRLTPAVPLVLLLAYLMLAFLVIV